MHAKTTLAQASDPRPIGVFDSGLGGLTVVRAILELCPSESLIYLGDTARVPYGPRSPEAVTRYAKECAAFLLTHKVKLIVVACNTATAHALDVLQQLCPVPVIGVIGPAAEEAASFDTTEKLGIIATSGTCRSGAYDRALKDTSFRGEATMVACPLLVPLIEEGFIEHPATALILASYLAPLQRIPIDTLLLGCTHYPLLLPVIRQTLGPNVRVIDSAHAAARAVHAIAQLTFCAAAGPERPTLHFYATDLTPQLDATASRFLGRSHMPFALVTLDAVTSHSPTNA